MRKRIPPIRTDYGKRLASRNRRVRAKAEEQVRRLGSGANDVLFRELSDLERRASSGYAIAVFGWSVQVTAEFFLPNDTAHYRLLLALKAAPLLAFVAALIRTALVYPLPRAALLNALIDSGDDDRLLRPLLQLWSSPPWERFRRVGEDRAIAALIRRLESYQNSRNRLVPDDVGTRLRRKLAVYFLLDPNGGNAGRFGSRFFLRDITPAEADLLVTIARLLARDGTTRDEILLHRIGALHTRQPNRRFVCDAARVLSDAKYAAANRDHPGAPAAMLPVPPVNVPVPQASVSAGRQP